MPRNPKFTVGSRIIGKEEDGRASFRGRTGTVLEGPVRSEYKVQFDDGQTEWVNASWIEFSERDSSLRSE